MRKTSESWDNTADIERGFWELLVFGVVCIRTGYYHGVQNLFSDNIYQDWETEFGLAETSRAEMICETGVYFLFFFFFILLWNLVLFSCLCQYRTLLLAL